MMDDKSKFTIVTILVLACVTILFALNQRWMTNQIQSSQQIMLSKLQQVQAARPASVTTPTTTNTAAVEPTDQDSDEQFEAIDERLGSLENNFTQIMDQLDDLQTTLVREDQFDNLPMPSESDADYAASSNLVPASGEAKPGPVDSELAAQEIQREQEFKTLETAHAAEVADQWADETHTTIQTIFNNVREQWPDADVNVNNVDCRQSGCRVEIEYANPAEFHRMQMVMLLELTPTLPTMKAFPQPGQDGKNKTVMFFNTSE